MLILLSPSKTQEMGPQYQKFSIPQYLTKTQELVNGLRKLDQNALAELMQISGKLAKTTWERFAAFTFPPDKSLCRQALLAFRGDVFAEIDADNYTDVDFDFAQKHLRILSGLYGILRPLDLIQPYCLEIGGKYRPGRDQNLYGFWQDSITESLHKTLLEGHQPLLLNLASNEYFKSVKQDKIQGKIVNVVFKQSNKGKLRTIAVHAKRARGALANFIIKNRLLTIGDLTDFNYNGYAYEEDLSTEDTLFYIQHR